MEVNQPKIGMKLSKHQSELAATEFSLLVNGNIQSSNGDVLIVTNEQSNLLCSYFKPNYKVIEVLPINVQNRTIFFLVNSLTNQSEIGYIDNIYYDDENDLQLNCKNCNKPLKEEELNTKLELCTYNTIVNNPCLNFNINYPIISTYSIGVDIDTGLQDNDNTTIYFTDFLNKRRYLNISDYPKVVTGYGDCNQPIYSEELDCNAIKIVPEYKDPCVSYIDTPIGGSNKAGVYQIATTYANISGEALTDYSTISNPISLSSLQRQITVNTDYDTNKSIKFTLSNVDTQFNWINIVVVKTINQLTEAFIVATLPINSDTLTYTYTGDSFQKEKRITLDELQKKRGIYEYAEGVSTANKHLFWFGLKDQRTINLQPVIKDIPLQWHSVEANEGFYGNSLSADFVSFERDETYPFGIEFRKTNGYKTPTFLFVGRDAQYYQNTYGINVNEHLGTTNQNYIDFPSCTEEILDKRWQVYNTAQVSGTSSCYNESGTYTYIPTETRRCVSNTWEEGEIAPLPCNDLNPSGNCSDINSPDYECCIIETVIPSGVVELPIYTQVDLPLATPPDVMSGGSAFEWNNVLTGEVIPDNAGLATWSPQNRFCSDPKQIFPSNDGNCTKETYIATDDTTPTAVEVKNVSENPYVFFTANATLPTDQYDCNNNSFTAVANTYWLSFSATSTTHLVRAIATENFVVRVLEGTDCSNIPITPVVNYNGTTNPSCVSESANNTAYITLNNLTPGNTYYIQVYVTALGSGSAYGNICISTPIPESFYDYNQNAVYRWICEYNVSFPDQAVVLEKNQTCFASPYKFGDFAYTESILNYPNNPEVWGDLCGKPIRHFRFPDSCVSHIHNEINKNGNKLNVSKTPNKIYPIGVKINPSDIKEALNQAVTLGLITEEEKLEFTSFSIKRGNRRNNRTVVAKGLMYDMWNAPRLNGDGKIPDNVINNQYYPNYPYNDLHDDVFLLNEYDGNSLRHPFKYLNKVNNRWTFHSPNTSFNRPILGNELKLETVEYGYTQQNLSEVEKHAKYVLLKNKAYDVAKGLAAVQINHEASMEAFGAGDSPSVLGTGGGSIINYIIYYAIGLATGFATNYTKYAQDWLDIIKGVSTPINYAFYYTSLGVYNNYKCVPDNQIKRKLLTNAVYLNPGNYQFPENGKTIFVNNWNRESSVYLSTETTSFQGYIQNPNFDISIPEDSSRIVDCTKSNTASGIITSYYASIKDYKPDQYGSVEDIEWLDTGYCGVLNWESSTPSGECEIAFGGDTYINRFSLKRKMPFFLQDRVGFEDENPVMYKDLFNVGFPKYYFNTLQDQSSLDKFSLPFLAPPNVNLDEGCDEQKPFYYRGKAYLYNYGVPSFITESDYNVDLRHGENTGDYKDFYPHIQDLVEWTQQYKNPISFDNTHYYNVDYSKQNRENFYYTLKNNYSEALSELRALYPNRAIYSGQGVEYWGDYLAADYYDFPLEDGKLVFLNGIERDRIVARQENSTKVFNAYITQESSLETIQISVGDMFATKPQEYYKSDLGFGGSNHRAFVSTPFGHFYVDSQNPSIFQLQNGLKDITRDSKTNNKIQWFNENLPFNIVKDFPNYPVDNAFNTCGISLGWDNKFDRLFITKKDYKLKKQYKNKVTYSDFNLYLDDSIISPTDNRYFEDKSWTIAYSPLLQEWVSFYTFVPNYYISTETYFQTGIDDSLWSHLLTEKSHQTFYGKTAPFIIEYAVKTTPANSILNNIQTNAEFRRYQKDLSYFVKDNVFYDYSEVYNNNQATGRLKLIPKIKNNSFQTVQYPKIQNNETQILAENIENFWRFSQGLYDISIQNGQPLYTYNENSYKTLNPLSISYTPKYLKNQLRNDFHVIRFENNKPLYKIEHRFNITQSSNSNT
jgi:hypothetical protein